MRNLPRDRSKKVPAKNLRRSKPGHDANDIAMVASGLAATIASTSVGDFGGFESSAQGV